MKFFDSFWKKSFYTEGKATSFWGAFGKVTLVSFVLSIAYAIGFYVTFGIHIPSYIYSYGVQALSGYPSGLVVTIDHEKMTKNIEGAMYLYPIPEGKVGKVRMEEVLPEYLIAINDKESVSLEAYHRSNALILLGKDGIVTQGNREVQIMSYKDALHTDDSFVITKDTVVGMVSAVNMYAPSLPWLIFVGIIILFSIFAPLGYLLITLFNGLVVMLFGKKILKKEATYGESYVYAMYALAPVIIITSILSVPPLIQNLVNVIPFLGTVGVVIFLWYMFTKDSPKKITAKKEKKVATDSKTMNLTASKLMSKSVTKTTTRKKKVVKE